MADEASIPDVPGEPETGPRPADAPRWTGKLNPDLLVILASRSSGPGGQNVNKVATKAQVRLDVPSCEDLSQTERRKVLRYVAETRPSLLTRDDEILISNNETRSFHENRSRAIGQLETLITEALTVRKKRIPTRTPRSAIARRLNIKKQVGATKRSRRERPEQE